jgi:hypothetical protein
MRESRTYGSVRGARDEIGVPTATGVDGPMRACPVLMDESRGKWRAAICPDEHKQDQGAFRVK